MEVQKYLRVNPINLKGIEASRDPGSCMLQFYFFLKDSQYFQEYLQLVNAFFILSYLLLSHPWES